MKVYIIFETDNRWSTGPDVCKVYDNKLQADTGLKLLQAKTKKKAMKEAYAVWASQQEAWGIKNTPSFQRVMESGVLVWKHLEEKVKEGEPKIEFSYRLEAFNTD